jgi:glycosyltransferase involved in cell wall biosynthesis
MKIGIVIPAHNEAMTIAKCLASVQSAIRQLPSTIKAYPLVVLDSCTDETQKIVKAAGIDYLCCDYQCVGQVRDIGIRHTIANGATWLACTDADSMVAVDWLVQQIEHISHQSTEMICGVVDVDSWAHLTLQTRDNYIDHYQDKMGHSHIHGANLSFSSDAYLAVGGFAHISCHEDVDLVGKFEAQGLVIIWSNRVRVMTSSRLQARATGGFAAFLNNLEQNSLY